MSAPDGEHESTCSSDDGSIADYCLTTVVGHNTRPSRAVDKSRMVAAIDAELRDKDGDPIPPKQQRAPSRLNQPANIIRHISNLGNDDVI